MSTVLQWIEHFPGLVGLLALCVVPRAPAEAILSKELSAKP